MENLIYELLKRLVEVKNTVKEYITDDEIKNKIEFFQENDKISNDDKDELLSSLENCNNTNNG